MIAQHTRIKLFDRRNTMEASLDAIAHVSTHLTVGVCRSSTDSVPELQEDYGGVETARLFVAGDILLDSPMDIAQKSKDCGIGVFLRIGKDFDLGSTCLPKGEC